MLAQAEALHGAGRIREALAKVEEARQENDYLAEPEFRRVNALFASSCKRTRLRNHRVCAKDFSKKAIPHMNTSLPCNRPTPLLMGCDQDGVTFMEDNGCICAYSFKDDKVRLVYHSTNWDAVGAISPDGNLALLSDAGNRSFRLLNLKLNRVARRFALAVPAVACGVNDRGDAAFISENGQRMTLRFCPCEGAETDVPADGLYQQSTEARTVCVSPSGSVAYAGVQYAPANMGTQYSGACLRQSDSRKKGDVHPVFPALLAGFGAGDATALAGNELRDIDGKLLCRFPVQNCRANCMLPSKGAAFFISDEGTLFLCDLPAQGRKPEAEVLYQAKLGGARYQRLCVTPDGGMLIARQELERAALRFAMIALDWEYQEKQPGGADEKKQGLFTRLFAKKS